MDKKGNAVFIAILAFIIFVYSFEFNADGYLHTVQYKLSLKKISDNVYIHRGLSGKTEEILQLIDSAKERNRELFGELKFEECTSIIISGDKKLASMLCGEKDTRTYFFPSKKNFITISDKYLDIDVVSHEIAHAELHTRLTVNALDSLPVWFDEGLATQVDHRKKYSQKVWESMTNDGHGYMPLPENMDEPSEFYAGSKEEKNQLNYLCAKHEVGLWRETHDQKDLLELIDKLNNGEDFDTAYGEYNTDFHFTQLE